MKNWLFEKGERYEPDSEALKPDCLSSHFDCYYEIVSSDRGGRTR